MSVSWIMTRNITRAGMDDTVGQVRNALEQAHFHHLLVIHKGQLVGILSDRDILNATTPFNDTRNETSRDEALLSRRVHQVMTRHPLTIPQTSTIKEASAIMLIHGISCLPVVNEKETVVGIVSMRDLLRHYMAMTIQVAS